MNITNFAIQHKTSVILLSVMITILGTISYMTLPREAAPDITLPYIIVTGFYEGTSPSDMESLVTRPIERKLKALTDVKKMTSVSMEGMSQTVVQFESDVEPDTALQKVRDKVSQARGELPDGMRDPSVQEISMSDWPIMFVVISGDVGLVQLKKIAEDLKDEITGVRGVLSVDIVGGLEREIRVEFDQDRLSAYGLTVAEVAQTISRNNLNVPGGSLNLGEAKYVMKTQAEFRSPDEINNLVVSIRNGKPIYLTDGATIRDTFKDVESFSRLDGAEAVSLRISKRPGEHVILVAKEIKALVAAMQRKYPEQIKIVVTSDLSKTINTLVKDLGNNIVTGIVLVLIVVFVSLGFRNAVIVATAIPLSMLITFFVIDAMGVTMNMVVLFSLVLAAGMVVDNAIVIVENIYRHHVGESKPLTQAAMEGTGEVLWPVLGSTATTVVAFLPLQFWPGIMGDFMGYLPLTVNIALIASFLVSIIINPTFCAMFIKPSARDRKIVEEETTAHFGPIISTYQKLLRLTLEYRVIFLLFFFSLFGVLLYAFIQSNLGVEMFPSTQPSQIMIKLKTPQGTNVQQTNNFAIQAEQIIKKYGNIQHTTTSVGDGGANAAEIDLEMIDKQERQASGTDGKIYFTNSNDTMNRIRDELLTTVVGAEITIDKQEMGPPVGRPVNVEIHGEDYAVLARLAAQLQDRIRTVPGLVDLSDDYDSGFPEIRVTVDKERAALMGLDAMLIGQFIKAAVNGTKVGSYKEGEDEFDITARLPEEQRKNIQNIMRLRVPNYTGVQVPLSSVAEVVTTSGLSAIRHIDQKRVITVFANVTKGANSRNVLAAVRKFADEIQADQSLMPEGYKFAYTGENEDFGDSQSFMFKAFMIAILLVALVIVLQFDSMLQTFIIMTTVILSLIGVFLSLIVTQKPFGVIMTGMGVISLAGVVVNNGIVLLDYINVLRRRGFPLQEAIVRAGCTRFRPVLLTAATMILGLVPTAFGIAYDFYEWRWDVGGESVEMWGPMATCVSYGLTVATVLTLFVVPCLCLLLYKKDPRPVTPPPLVAQELEIAYEKGTSEGQ
jgi:multidrug efflux pump